MWAECLDMHPVLLCAGVLLARTCIPDEHSRPCPTSMSLDRLTTSLSPFDDVVTSMTFVTAPQLGASWRVTSSSDVHGSSDRSTGLPYLQPTRT